MFDLFFFILFSLVNTKANKQQIEEDYCKFIVSLICQFKNLFTTSYIF